MWEQKFIILFLFPWRLDFIGCFSLISLLWSLGSIFYFHIINFHAHFRLVDWWGVRARCSRPCWTRNPVPARSLQREVKQRPWPPPPARVWTCSHASTGRPDSSHTTGPAWPPARSRPTKRYPKFRFVSAWTWPGPVHTSDRRLRSFLVARARTRAVSWMMLLKCSGWPWFLVSFQEKTPHYSWENVSIKKHLWHSQFSTIRLKFSHFTYITTHFIHYCEAQCGAQCEAHVFS